MIYQLPSHSPRTYRGQYPSCIHSSSIGKTCHFELNDGRRFVCTSNELRRDMPSSFYGKELIAILKPGATSGGVTEMSVADYAGIVLVQRIMRCVRGMTEHNHGRLDIGWLTKR